MAADANSPGDDWTATNGTVMPTTHVPPTAVVAMPPLSLSQLQSDDDTSTIRLDSAAVSTGAPRLNPTIIHTAMPTMTLNTGSTMVNTNNVTTQDLQDLRTEMNDQLQTIRTDIRTFACDCEDHRQRQAQATVQSSTENKEEKENKSNEAGAAETSAPETGTQSRATGLSVLSALTEPPHVCFLFDFCLSYYSNHFLYVCKFLFFFFLQGTLSTRWSCQ